MVNYPPYVEAYGLLKELFKRIKEAAVPPKFTQDFLSTVLSLKSSSYRPMIPFLKRVGFIDQANVPTKAYSNFRDESKSKYVMAEQIKSAYNMLFAANIYAHRLKKEDIVSKLSSVLGTSRDDKTLPKVAATFMGLCKLADFEAQPEITDQEEVGQEVPVESPTVAVSPRAKLGISYTINLNLPATTDVKVFDAIFKSLKENLLK